jgi:PBP1b-binding outer membrane lipoprotein LpoB
MMNTKRYLNVRLIAMLVLSCSWAMAQEPAPEVASEDAVPQVPVEVAKSKPTQPKRLTKKSSEFRVS